MRWDAEGIFWKQPPSTEKRRGGARAPARAGNRPLPPIPATGWRHPEVLPSLAGYRRITIDVETKDSGLDAGRGPGWPTNDGYVVGLAVGVETGERWYLPIRHKMGGNMDPEVVLRWARKELGRKGQLKIGANLMYDVGWLLAEGVQVEGPFFDVQWAEALLDEHRKSYNLDSIAYDRLGEHKTSEELYEWCAQAFGGKADGTQRKNIWRAPVELVGPYAEGDVDLPDRLFTLQSHLLEKDELTRLADMEMRLLPLLVAMRKRGVRVDSEAAIRVSDQLLARVNGAQSMLDAAAGRKVNANSAEDLAPIFRSAGVKVPVLKSGRPSITKDWLSSCKHPLAKTVLEVRRLAKNKTTFVDGYIGKFAVNGRIHGEFHPLRSDDGGTVSGRFSSSNPNLQNIPARDKEMKKLIRGMFLPDEGEDWVCMDHSQIEYRLLVNAAVGGAGAAARRMYCENPKTDYHEFTSDLVTEILHRELDRKPIKNINFGTIFGMGRNKLIGMLGLEQGEAEAFFDAYNKAIPYAADTREAAARAVRQKGVITTILGRKARFPFWESADWDTSQRDGYMSEELARKKYGDRIIRARAHKGLNSYTQGGGADILKAGMVECWESGVCDILGAPLLTVHDELDWSKPRTRAGHEAILEAKYLMENVAPDLRVPLIVDIEIGSDWGHLEEFDHEFNATC